MSDEAVLAATGRTWGEWRMFLDGEGAAALPHAAIVTLLAATGIPGWWRQMVTVGYERMIGRRDTGQTCAGDWSASASRTIAGNMDQAIARWTTVAEAQDSFAGVSAQSAPRQSASGKWRYWRIDLADGSKVAVNACDKAGGKAIVGISHDGLPDAESVARAKAFWKGLLQQL